MNETAASLYVRFLAYVQPAPIFRMQRKKAHQKIRAV